MSADAQDAAVTTTVASDAVPAMTTTAAPDAAPAASDAGQDLRVGVFVCD
jgi:hypothetical protein